jgi:hypothetical protein
MELGIPLTSPTGSFACLYDSQKEPPLYYARLCLTSISPSAVEGGSAETQPPWTQSHAIACYVLADLLVFFHRNLIPCS